MYFMCHGEALLHIIFDLAIEGEVLTILECLLKAPYLGLGNHHMEGDSPIVLSLVSQGRRYPYKMAWLLLGRCLFLVVYFCCQFCLSPLLCSCLLVF